MKTIGLVGGIASGKSLVARMLGGLGASVLDADHIGHAVLAEDAEVRDALRRQWGEGVLAADGRLDRAAIAHRVFAPGMAGEEDRRFLEGLLHPRIRARLESQRDATIALGVAPAVVVDAALLFEAGWNTICDLVVMVDAPQPVRRDRAHQRGWTDDQFAAREAAQWPLEEKRRRADLVLANGGSEAKLRLAVQAFWDRYVAP